MFDEMDKVINDFFNDTDEVLEKVRKQVKTNTNRRYAMNNDFYRTPTEAGKSREFYKKIMEAHQDQVGSYINATYDKDDFAVSVKNDVYLEERDGEIYHCVRTAIKSFEGWNREFITRYDSKGTPLYFNVRII